MQLDCYVYDAQSHKKMSKKKKEKDRNFRSLHYNAHSSSFYKISPRIDERYNLIVVCIYGSPIDHVQHRSYK
jgi:hypothetical protein